MLSTPSLLSTQVVGDDTFGNMQSYRIEGGLVPVLSVDVTQQPVYFEHHVLLWKHPGISLGFKVLRKGALTRMVGGMRILLVEASGVGSIAFSRDGAGQIVPIHLAPGEALHVREHQFLAATRNIDYACERVTGMSNVFLGNSGFFIDKFHSTKGEGVLWLHGYGNVFEIMLASGESIDVEPRAWVYKTPSVQLETLSPLSSKSLLSRKVSGNTFGMNRFTGPGRVGIQSMTALPVEAEQTRPQQSVGGTLFNLLAGLGRLLSKK